jgi:hypothetical protein
MCTADIENHERAVTTLTASLLICVTSCLRRRKSCRESLFQHYRLNSCTSDDDLLAKEVAIIFTETEARLNGYMVSGAIQI